MGTAVSEIITNFAMVEIDDERLNELAQVNPALFYRRMTLYFDAAMPIFSRPPEIKEYLYTGFTEPAYADYTWVSTEESTQQETVVSTGFTTGYELFSCSEITSYSNGSISVTPYTSATYNAEAGTVTFPQQAQAGITYTMDFYNDGSFANDLTQTQKRILGLCVAMVWYERFATTWLNMQPKEKDSSSNAGPEHSHITANTGRLREIRTLLSSELNKYEQDCAYMTNRPYMGGLPPQRLV